MHRLCLLSEYFFLNFILNKILVAVYISLFNKHVVFLMILSLIFETRVLIYVK